MGLVIGDGDRIIRAVNHPVEPEMTDHEAPVTNDDVASEDSAVDAFAAVILILIAVATVIYWVAGQ